MLSLATEPGELLPSLLPWLLLLLGLVAVGGAVLYAARRWVRDEEQARSEGPGFTLQDLRDMHRSGKLSDREFERAKAAMIEQIRRAAARDAENETTS
jgi:hypothetical protein